MHNTSMRHFILLFIILSTHAFASSDCFRGLRLITNDYLVKRADMSEALGNTLIRSFGLSTHERLIGDPSFLNNISDLIDETKAWHTLIGQRISLQHQMGAEEFIDHTIEKQEVYYRALIRVLRSLDIRYRMVDVDGMDVLEILPGTTNRLSRLIHKYTNNDQIKVVIAPANFVQHGQEASFSRGTIFISLNSILQLDAADGRVVNFLRPTATEWHEYQHARFYVARQNGQDDIFDAFIRSRNNTGINSTYARGFVLEETDVYLSETRFQKAKLRNLLNHFDSYDWSIPRPAEIMTVIELRRTFVETINPMLRMSRDSMVHPDTLNDINVMAVGREMNFVGESIVGTIDESDNVLRLELDNGTEIVQMYFHNPFIVRRFKSTSDAQAIKRLIIDLVTQRYAPLNSELLRMQTISDEFEVLYQNLTRATNSYNAENIRAAITAIHNSL